MKQPKAKPVDRSVETIEATIRAVASELKTAGIRPDGIRLAVWEAVEPGLPALPQDQRRDLELRLHQALDEVLAEPGDQPA